MIEFREHIGAGGIGRITLEMMTNGIVQIREQIRPASDARPYHRASVSPDCIIDEDGEFLKRSGISLTYKDDIIEAIKTHRTPERLIEYTRAHVDHLQELMDEPYDEQEASNKKRKYLEKRFTDMRAAHLRQSIAVSKRLPEVVQAEKDAVKARIERRYRSMLG